MFGRSRKSRSRRFLQGLSSDELQFIAEYLAPDPGIGADGPVRAHEFAYARGYSSRPAGRCPSPDEEHKMILLLEFLWRGSAKRRPARPTFLSG